MLTTAQREFYEENGYLVIRRLVSPIELERYHERFNLICDGKVDRPLGMTVMRDGTDVCTGGGHQVHHDVKCFIFFVGCWCGWVG